MTTAVAYSPVIKKTMEMVPDQAIQRRAEQHGLHVLNATWEDMGRFDFSAVGPNISDMTILTTCDHCPLQRTPTPARPRSRNCCIGPPLGPGRN